MMTANFRVIVALSFIAAGRCMSVSKATLPTVTLPYEIHQAYSLIDGVYNFSNIRYAAAPTGSLRFQPPASPSVSSSTVDTGIVGRMCPQANPLWLGDLAYNFVVDYLSGEEYTGPTSVSSSSYTPGPQDPRITEDCLFLDVLTPQSIFNSETASAPVIVWIYGGGYTEGDKSFYNGTSLILRNIVDGGEGFVYVGINYRLGAFGFLSGSGATENVGLLDQRFALEWVQTNIHLFGGNPNNVTIMGESAGGGSVLTQITAYGGKNKPPPFQRAILQSPAIYPYTCAMQQSSLQDFLGLLNVTTVAAARKLESSQLIAANEQQIALAPWGNIPYGPVASGSFLPELPSQLLLNGEFYQSIEVMVAHNSDEGLAFTPPTMNTTENLPTLLEDYFPALTSSDATYLLDTLYPAIFDGSYGYVDAIGRAAAIIGDTIISCNTDFVNKAFSNNTYAYEFAVFPGIHGQDVSYTFYSGVSASVSNVTVAYGMQDYITSFVVSSTPKSSLGPTFSKHGGGALELEFNQASIAMTQDTTSSSRCAWLQTTL